jgi:hypothetical protein
MNITFTVTINYTHDDDGVICPDSMRDNLWDNLYTHIPQLTPENIEVTALEVSLQEH